MSSPATTFPPQLPAGIGSTFSMLNLQASLTSTTAFIVQIPGYYLLNALIHIVSTDGTGTLAGALATPYSSPLAFNPILATPADGSFASRAYWLNTGDQISVSVTATGLVATTYDVFVNLTQLL